MCVIGSRHICTHIILPGRHIYTHQTLTETLTHIESETRSKSSVYGTVQGMARKRRSCITLRQATLQPGKLPFKSEEWPVIH